MNIGPVRQPDVSAGTQNCKASVAAKRARTILILHSVLLVWVLLAFGVCFSGNATFMLRSACSIFTGVSIWLVASWLWSGGRILSPYCLFLVSTLIFNGGQLWLYAFDPTIAILSNEFSPEITLKTILLVTASIMFLHLGAVLALRPAAHSTSQSL